MKRYVVSIIVLLLFPSCLHVISKENLEDSITGIPFREVTQNAEGYLNRKFIFGGIIAETMNGREGSEIEIVQTPIDRWGNVVARDISEGRFIVAVKRYLDPLIFRAGREITISGVLIGTQRKMLGGVDYTYPVFEAREIRLRPEELYYPYPVWREPLYYPYPYYWYDPFRNKPFHYPY